TKNALEGYVYDTRGKLEDCCVAYCVQSAETAVRYHWMMRMLHRAVQGSRGHPWVIDVEGWYARYESEAVSWRKGASGRVTRLFREGSMRAVVEIRETVTPIMVFGHYKTYFSMMKKRENAVAEVTVSTTDQDIDEEKEDDLQNGVSIQVFWRGVAVVLWQEEDSEVVDMASFELAASRSESAMEVEDTVFDGARGCTRRNINAIREGETKQDSNKVDAAAAIPKHQRKMFPTAGVCSRKDCHAL
ncbi:hypothetical protein OG21DRAFT_1528353, partial [Imleria badia]